MEIDYSVIIPLFSDIVKVVFPISLFLALATRITNYILSMLSGSKRVKL